MIGTLADRLTEQIREQRQEWKIRPVYKMVDTCAAEFDAATPYFYSTYETENEAIPANRKKAVVIGSGPIRIGQGIEFDYCSVHAARALKEAGYQSIMINSNPETVSTDSIPATASISNRWMKKASAIFWKMKTAIMKIRQKAILLRSCSSAGRRQSIWPTRWRVPECLFWALPPNASTCLKTAAVSSNFRQFGHPQPPGAGVTSIEEALKVANSSATRCWCAPAMCSAAAVWKLCTMLPNYLIT